jgi:hypothetical protein
MSDHRLAASSTIARSEVNRAVGAITRWPMPHHTWIVAVVTFATLLIAGGHSGSAGIPVVPLETEFHWSRAMISFAVGVNMAFYGLIGPFAATLMNSVGSRRTMLGALVAIGIAMTPAMQEPWA